MDIKRIILGYKYRIVVLSLLRSIVYSVCSDEKYIKDKIASSSRVSKELVDELNRLEREQREAS